MEEGWEIDGYFTSVQTETNPYCLGVMSVLNERFKLLCAKG